MDLKLLTLFTTVLITGCSAGDYCWYYDDYYNGRYRYCEDGCCGSYESNVCCDNDLATVWIIVGSVIGGIIGLALLISFICCVIFMMKRNHKPGMVIHPANSGQVTAISTGVQQPVPPPYGHLYPTYQSQGGQPPPPPYRSVTPTAPLP